MYGTALTEEEIAAGDVCSKHNFLWNLGTSFGTLNLC
jgi:hypothetical protein